eukprot:10588224-Alexandrium_andersonii.AAC.1
MSASLVGSEMCIRDRLCDHKGGGGRDLQTAQEHKSLLERAPQARSAVWQSACRSAFFLSLIHI